MYGSDEDMQYANYHRHWLPTLLPLYTAVKAASPHSGTGRSSPLSASGNWENGL